MTPGELAQIHALCFDVAPRAWDEAEFQEFADQENIEITQHAQGFAVVRVAAGEAELLTLAVHPDARRQGIARHVMEEALAKAKKSGAQVMFLEVADGNEPALQLYRTIGFEEAGLRKDYYAAPNGPKLSARVLKLLL